jgi:thiamine biosynthesis lipoprotein ApbE
LQLLLEFTADAVWTVCRREAEVIDMHTGYPLVQRHVVVYRATDAADADREARRLNALPWQPEAP